MPRITREEYLIEFLDFILNQAEESELDAIHNAMLRRGRRTGIEDLNFKDMAGQMANQLNIEMPDFNQMTREMVMNIILEHEPGIAPEELHALLQHYVPDKNSQVEAQTAQIPSDVIQEMLRQFISYSLGQMPATEEKALRTEMPDWPEKYWAQFPSDTRTWVRALIKNEQSD